MMRSTKVFIIVIAGSASICTLVTVQTALTDDVIERVQVLRYRGITPGEDVGLALPEVANVTMVQQQADDNDGGLVDEASISLVARGPLGECSGQAEVTVVVPRVVSDVTTRALVERGKTYALERCPLTTRRGFGYLNRIEVKVLIDKDARTLEARAIYKVARTGEASLVDYRSRTLDRLGREENTLRKREAEEERREAQRRDAIGGSEIGPSSTKDALSRVVEGYALASDENQTAKHGLYKHFTETGGGMYFVGCAAPADYAYEAGAVISRYVFERAEPVHSVHFYRGRLMRIDLAPPTDSAVLLIALREKYGEPERPSGRHIKLTRKSPGSAFPSEGGAAPIGRDRAPDQEKLCRRLLHGTSDSGRLCHGLRNSLTSSPT